MGLISIDVGSTSTGTLLRIFHESTFLPVKSHETYSAICPLRRPGSLFEARSDHHDAVPWSSQLRMAHKKDVIEKASRSPENHARRACFVADHCRSASFSGCLGLGFKLLTFYISFKRRQRVSDIENRIQSSCFYWLRRH